VRTDVNGNVLDLQLDAETVTDDKLRYKSLDTETGDFVEPEMTRV